MENPNQSVEIWDQCRKFFSVASDMELYSQGQFLLQHFDRDKVIEQIQKIIQKYEPEINMLGSFENRHVVHNVDFDQKSDIEIQGDLVYLNSHLPLYSCHLHFSNSDRNYVKNALDRLVELNLLHFNPQEVQHIKDVIDLRNRVHIRLTNGNELSNADFNRDIYNDAVNLLKTVDEQIYQYAVPLYGCGHTIPISREP